MDAQKTKKVSKSIIFEIQSLQSRPLKKFKERPLRKFKIKFKKIKFFFTMIEKFLSFYLPKIRKWPIAKIEFQK